MINYQFSEDDSYYVINRQGKYFAFFQQRIPVTAYILGFQYYWTDKIVEATAVKLETAQYLKKIVTNSKQPVKIVESEEHLNTLFLNLLLQVVTIARTELEAMTIGEKVLQLLMSHGLANAEPDIKIEDIELKQFNF